MSVRVKQSLQKYYSICNFNTTLVSVRGDSEARVIFEQKDFNTTLVSVREGRLCQALHILTNFNTTLVSVRDWSSRRENRKARISIQLLCRFEIKLFFKLCSRTLFQYNSCVGSRLLQSELVLTLFNFNTTLVSVRDRRGYRTYRRRFISIQLLCRFELRSKITGLESVNFNTTLVSVRVLILLVNSLIH